MDWSAIAVFPVDPKAPVESRSSPHKARRSVVRPDPTSRQSHDLAFTDSYRNVLDLVRRGDLVGAQEWLDAYG